MNRPYDQITNETEKQKEYDRISGNFPKVREAVNEFIDARKVIDSKKGSEVTDADVEAYQKAKEKLDSLDMPFANSEMVNDKIYTHSKNDYEGVRNEYLEKYSEANRYENKVAAKYSQKSENKPIPSNEEAKAAEVPIPTKENSSSNGGTNPPGETTGEGTGEEPPIDQPINVEDDLGNVGRRFTQQMLRTEDLTPEAKEAVRKTLEYVEQTNEMSSQEAEKTIKDVGVDEAFKLVTDRNNNVNGGVRTTMAQAIIKSYNELSKTAPDEATRNEYLDKTIQTATFVTEKLATDAGQSIQAFSLWERLSPEAQLRAEIKDRKSQVNKQKQSVRKDVDKVGQKLQK